MAICVHKLVSRASVMNPILMHSRHFATPSFNTTEQFDTKIARFIAPVAKPNLLNTEAQSFTQTIRCFSNTTNLRQENASNQPSSDGGASDEQLTIIYESLREDLPQLFVTSLDYTKVHKEIVFENRIRGKTYVGIVDYVKQISFLRLYGHFIYAYVKLDVIKMTKHTEDSSIKIRWRITGITGYQILFKMIKFRVWDPKRMIAEHQKVWLEGFSTFYVNNQGLIVKHIADKVMPDEDKQLNPIEKIVSKLGNAPKLALFVNLFTEIAPTVVV